MHNTDTHVARFAGCSYVDDLAERAFEHVEHVRTDVEHCAAFEAPIGCKRTAERRARHERCPAADRVGCGRGREEFVEAAVEAVREHDERAHAGLVDGVDDGPGRGNRIAERLFEQERFARSCGAYGDCGLRDG